MNVHQIFANAINQRIIETHIPVTHQQRVSIIRNTWYWEFLPLLITGELFPDPLTLASRTAINNMIVAFDADRDAEHYDYNTDDAQVRGTWHYRNILQRDFNIGFHQFLATYFDVFHNMVQEGVYLP
jgi:hypothetical protein